MAPTTPLSTTGRFGRSHQISLRLVRHTASVLNIEGIRGIRGSTPSGKPTGPDINRSISARWVREIFSDLCVWLHHVASHVASGCLSPRNRHQPHHWVISNQRSCRSCGHGMNTSLHLETSRLRTSLVQVPPRSGAGTLKGVAPLWAALASQEGSCGTAVLRWADRRSGTASSVGSSAARRSERSLRRPEGWCPAW